MRLLIALLFATSASAQPASARVKIFKVSVTRRTAAVGAVGSSFTLGSGLEPLDLAR